VHVHQKQALLAAVEQQGERGDVGDRVPAVLDAVEGALGETGATEGLQERPQERSWAVWKSPSAMACAQASATSPDPAYAPWSGLAGSASRAPPGRSPVAPSRVGLAADAAAGEDEDEDEDEDDALVAAGAGVPSPQRARCYRVSSRTSSRPRPKISSAPPTTSHGSRFRLFGGGPYGSGYG
jgi:hypothetical protein